MEDRYDFIIFLLVLVGFGALYLIYWAAMRLLETADIPHLRAYAAQLRRFRERVGGFLDRHTDSPLLPPWGAGDRLPAEPVRGQFHGLFKRLYVTKNFVVVTGPFGYFRAIRLVDIAQVRSGFGPSPHDSGPDAPWGIWIKERSGKESAAWLFKPHEAASLINELKAAALRRERAKSGRTDIP